MSKNWFFFGLGLIFTYEFEVCFTEFVPQHRQKSNQQTNLLLRSTLDLNIFQPLTRPNVGARTSRHWHITPLRRNKISLSNCRLSSMPWHLRHTYIYIKVYSGILQNIGLLRDYHSQQVSCVHKQMLYRLCVGYEKCLFSLLCMAGMAEL